MKDLICVKFFGLKSIRIIFGPLDNTIQRKCKSLILYRFFSSNFF